MGYDTRQIDLALHCCEFAMIPLHYTTQEIRFVAFFGAKRSERLEYSTYRLDLEFHLFRRGA